MPKKQKNADRRKREPKLGRPEELKVEDLPKRFRDMKSFLENYWGRVGLGLKRARRLEDVKSVLSLVQGIEWMPSFKGHASCLLYAKAIEATPTEIHATRRKHRTAEQFELSCWAAYHDAGPKAQQSSRRDSNRQFHNLMVFSIGSNFSALSCLLSTVVNVQKLTSIMPTLWEKVLKAQREKNTLKEALNAQEAWFARNEVVKFAKIGGIATALLNFARAMAGVPEWGWFHSRRTCEAMHLKSDPATPGKLFELLDSVICKTKPLDLSRVEKRVRRELQESSVDLFVREYVRPQWHYLEEAIRFCSGKNFRRSELTFKIMDRFIYHCERGKSTIDVELAKRNEL